jgi:hypothetical protein
MDVSELRKRILRALEDARKEAGERRAIVDEARRAYAGFLEETAVPLLRQAAAVMKSEGQFFTVHTPAESVRLVSDKSAETYLEIALETSGKWPQVVGRSSLVRGRQGRVDERPIAQGKAVADLTEDDLAQFLVKELPRLVIKS